MGESPKIVDEKESSNKSVDEESSKALDDEKSSRAIVKDPSKKSDENKYSQTSDDEESSKISDDEESSKESDDEESINDDEENSKTTLALKSDKAEEVSNSAAEDDESLNKEASVLEAKETGTDYHDETSDSDSVGGKTEGEITTIEPNSVEILTEISEPSKKEVEKSSNKARAKVTETGTDYIDDETNETIVENSVEVKEVEKKS